MSLGTYNQTREQAMGEAEEASPVEVYKVSVYDMDRKRQVAHNEFPVGRFSEIGYWLDDGGLIHPRYQVTILVGEPRP